MKQIGLYLLAFSLSVVTFASGALGAAAAPRAGGAGGAAGEFTEVTDFATKLLDFVNNTIIPLIIAIALLVFIWGMFKFFILGGSDDEKRKEGKNLILWSIIGFVLMFSIMGIVNMIATGFGFSEDTLDTLPQVPGIE